MHELSIACSILEIVEEEIKSRCNGSLRGRVPSLTVRIGSLSGVNSEALSFAWDVARERGPFPEADLQIERVEAEAVCLECGVTFCLEDGTIDCPQCGPAPFDLKGGRELEVRQIIWEDEES